MTSRFQDMKTRKSSIRASNTSFADVPEEKNIFRLSAEAGVSPTELVLKASFKGEKNILYTYKNSFDHQDDVFCRHGTSIGTSKTDNLIFPCDFINDVKGFLGIDDKGYLPYTTIRFQFFHRVAISGILFVIASWCNELVKQECLTLIFDDTERKQDGKPSMFELPNFTNTSHRTDICTSDYFKCLDRMGFKLKIQFKYENNIIIATKNLPVSEGMSSFMKVLDRGSSSKDKASENPRLVNLVQSIVRPDRFSASATVSSVFSASSASAAPSHKVFEMTIEPKAILLDEFSPVQVNNIISEAQEITIHESKQISTKKIGMIITKNTPLFPNFGDITAFYNETLQSAMADDDSACVHYWVRGDYHMESTNEHILTAYLFLIMDGLACMGYDDEVRKKSVSLRWDMYRMGDVTCTDMPLTLLRSLSSATDLRVVIRSGIIPEDLSPLVTRYWNFNYIVNLDALLIDSFLIEILNSNRTYDCFKRLKHLIIENMDKIHVGSKNYYVRLIETLKKKLPALHTLIMDSMIYSPNKFRNGNLLNEMKAQCVLYKAIIDKEFQVGSLLKHVSIHTPLDITPYRPGSYEYATWLKYDALRRETLHLLMNRPMQEGHYVAPILDEEKRFSRHDLKCADALMNQFTVKYDAENQRIHESRGNVKVHKRIDLLNAKFQRLIEDDLFNAYSKMNLKIPKDIMLEDQFVDDHIFIDDNFKLRKLVERVLFYPRVQGMMRLLTDISNAANWNNPQVLYDGLVQSLCDKKLIDDVLRLHGIVVERINYVAALSEKHAERARELNSIEWLLFGCKEIAHEK